MTNMTKDYYKILEVSEFCSEQDIKAAYRKLARKLHPDVAGNSEENVRRFKDLNEAYQALSNKAKRADYDTARRYYNYSSTTKKRESVNNATNPGFESKRKDEEHVTQAYSKEGLRFSWEEILSKYRQHSKQTAKNTSTSTQPKRGNDIHTDVEISFAEALSGTTKVINMLQTHICPKCGGRKFANGTVCNTCNGKGEISEYRKFSVKIPAGVKDNSKIRLSGEGEKGLNGGANGDLYIIVHIKAPLDYKTEGLNILKNVSIAPYEAVLGTNLKVKTPNGDVTVKITPNTLNGQKIRLSGCGIETNSKVGDMILTIEIQIPKNLTQEEVDLYKRLRDSANSKSY